MIDVSTLEGMAEKLRVYDVDQRGWEHEDRGLEVNAKHTHIHLSQDIVKKNFSDPETISSAIAPDLLQYSLRLGRWANLSVGNIWPQESHLVKTTHKSQELWGVPKYFAAYELGKGTVALAYHGTEHEKDRKTAIEEVPEILRDASSYLLLSTLHMSHDFELNLEEVFDARLANLRERFRIPEPDQIEKR